MQMKGGVPINDDVGLEAEADVMGAKALSVASSRSTHQLRSTNVVQSSAITAQLLAKVVDEAATHHYNDGWGALYGIVNDGQLKAKDTNEEAGWWTKDLGKFYHAVEGAKRPCTIGYKNTATTTYFKHCGPSDQ
jgi:hypothetical protein